MALAGGRVSHFRDPAADGRTAFVTDGDIPSHMVDVLNSVAEVDVMHLGADNDEASREPTNVPGDAQESAAEEVDKDSTDSCSEVSAHDSEADNVSNWSPDQSSEDSDSSSTSSSTYEPFPKHTYTLYCMMSIMHMNTLRLAEDTGERDVVGYIKCRGSSSLGSRHKC
ncbi:hypothetical protein OSTOST_01282 [Ostertagia ostertagi]